MIAIYGSPRRNGNTEILMDAFIKPVEARHKVRKFYLSEMNLQPCTSCGYCQKTGICIYKDAIAEIYDSIEKSNGLVIASPIFFTNVTAQVKAFVDRGQSYWVRKYVLGSNSNSNSNTVRPIHKMGYFLSVGAMDTDTYFKSSRMVIKSLMNSLNINYSGDLFFRGVDAKGDIRNTVDALEQAEEIGKIFAAEVEKV